MYRSHSCLTTPRIRNDSNTDSRGPRPSSSSRPTSSASPDPKIRRPPFLAVQQAKGTVEPKVAMGQLPVGESLIEKRCAKRDQPIIHKQVRIHAGRFQQHVAEPDS